MRVARFPGTGRPYEIGHYTAAHQFGNLLYDLAADPRQESPLRDPVLEERMVALLHQEMQRCDAPAEQYQRLGLAP